MTALRPTPRARAGCFGVLCALVTLAAAPSTALGQTDDDGFRVGFVLGGVSTFGLTFELFRGQESLDLTLGTWSFRDVSVAANVKRYIGNRAVRPFVGGGIWIVTAKPADERTGFAFVLQAPVGVDAGIRDDHHLGLTVNLNRALWVRRTNAEDDLPLNKRLVPLPGVYYRFESR